MSRNTLLAALLGLAFTGPALAAQADHVKVEHAWIRQLPGDLPAASYADLVNEGDAPAVLRSASSPAFASVMLHQSSHEGGMNRMSMIDHLDIPAHGRVSLAPGGYHVMLMDPAKPLAVGQKVPLRFEFADGSTLEANFEVRAANAGG